MKLNLGCGLQKLSGFINVDIDPAVKPDAVFDFTNSFPYQDETIEEVVAYHVLEHIPKFNHDRIYKEIYRVLIPGGKFTLSFPEFRTCVEYWLNNYKGKRDFWEATIYGRQSSPHDFHVAIMDREMVARKLVRAGFGITYKGTEPVELHNSVIRAVKMKKFTYQDALKESLRYDSE